MKYKKRHDQIVEVCQTALTLTEVEARLGVSTPNTTLRRYIKQNKIPLPHYEGQHAANRLSQKSRRRISDADLCENSTTNTGNIKRYLIRTNKKEVKCEQCGWCERRPSDGTIPIHLHHKNGDSADNRLENLEFLCPNCHSLTPNYAGKNNRNERRRKETALRQAYYTAPKYTCQVCGKLGYGEKFCSTACSHQATRKVVWPTKQELEKDINILSWTAIGRKYGVSDNAIRKWAKNFDLIT